MRLVEQAHKEIGSILSLGDQAIDATAGNGYDTLFLAQKVGVTDVGKKEILKNCIFFPSSKFKILHHSSGVRSGTKDRNPIIGRHPNHSNLFLFNGFGSRGTSTIPYYANYMANFLLQCQELPQDANLNRFEYEIS